PLPKGLAKIRIGFRNFPFGGHIENSSNAGDRVAAEAGGFSAGFSPLSLEQVVQKPSGISDVPAKIADSGSDRFDDHKPIGLRGRLYQSGHDPAVKRPDATIEGFDRIGYGLRKNDRAHEGRRRGGV